MARLPEFNAAGALLFVDSGAYPAFQRGFEVDFQMVFDGYHSLLRVLSRPENVALVAPDKIGDMVTTSALQVRWLPQIKELISTGAEVLVPVQCGWNLAAYLPYLQKLRYEIGSPFTLAFAYNKRAWSERAMARVVADFQPEKVHLLGIGKSRIGTAAGALWSVAPNVVVGHDSCRVRSLVGKGRTLDVHVHRHIEQKKAKLSRREAEETARFVGIFERDEDAELIADLFDLSDEVLMHQLCHVPGFLTPQKAAILANFMGIPSTADRFLEKFVRDSQRSSQSERFGCALGEFIELIAGRDLIEAVRFRVGERLRENRKIISSSSRRLGLAEVLSVERRQEVRNVQLQMLF